MTILLSLRPSRSTPYEFSLETSGGLAVQALLRPGKWHFQVLSSCCGGELAYFGLNGRPSTVSCGTCKQELPGDLPVRLAVVAVPYEAAGQAYELEDWLQEVCSRTYAPLEASAVAWALQERLGELCKRLIAVEAELIEAEEERVARLSPSQATYDRLAEVERELWRERRPELFSLCRELEPKRLHPPE